MGNARWSSTDWDQHVRSTATQSRTQIFKNEQLLDEFDPAKIAFRESRDSALNPQSTPIIIGSDVTGSMGSLAEVLIRKGIGVAVEEILRRKPVSDPHIMSMAIGDHESDQAPLQVTQFEADLTIAEQLARLWLEGNGGGNGGESYMLAWYFAGMRTRTDSFEKRGKKGYLFTVGDEPPHKTLPASEIKRIFGVDGESTTAADLLTLASRYYEVFHLVLHEGGRTHYPRALPEWRTLLGERALVLTDHTKLAEVIVSTIEVLEGRNKDSVVGSWSGDTSLVVANAIGALQTSQGGSGSGLVRF